MLLLGFISFGALAQSDDPLSESIKKSGEVRAALASSPPYIVVSPNGKATGYTVEIVNMALKGLDLPANTPALLAWDAMIPAVLARQLDFIGAGFAISAANCKVVLFSAPIFAMQYAL